MKGKNPTLFSAGYTVFEDPCSIRFPHTGISRTFDDFPALFRAFLAEFPENSFHPPVRCARLSARALKTVALCAAVVREADIVLPPDTVILGFGRIGAASDNLTYWRDYVKSGRTGGRGHLFVATLSGTPECEAAIALGIHGPVYTIDTCGDEARCMEEVRHLICAEGRGAVLAVSADIPAVTLYLPGDAL